MGMMILRLWTLVIDGSEEYGEGGKRVHDIVFAGNNRMKCGQVRYSSPVLETRDNIDKR